MSNPPPTLGAYKSVTAVNVSKKKQKKLDGPHTLGTLTVGARDLMIWWGDHSIFIPIFFLGGGVGTRPLVPLLFSYLYYIPILAP